MEEKIKNLIDKYQEKAEKNMEVNLAIANAYGNIVYDLKELFEKK